jgi:hypothetical protein
MLLAIYVPSISDIPVKFDDVDALAIAKQRAYYAVVISAMCTGIAVHLMERLIKRIKSVMDIGSGYGVNM